MCLTFGTDFLKQIWSSYLFVTQSVSVQLKKIFIFDKLSSLPKQWSNFCIRSVSLFSANIQLNIFLTKRACLKWEWNYPSSIWYQFLEIVFTQGP